MAVDAAGRFHPLWTDARRGTWQLYSATVRVLTDQQLAGLATSGAADRQHPCAQDSRRFKLLIGEPEFANQNVLARFLPR
jgi:hypothetical protein